MKTPNTAQIIERCRHMGDGPFKSCACSLFLKMPQTMSKGQRKADDKPVSRDKTPNSLFGLYKDIDTNLI